jgi:hypothetical protein
LAFTLDNRPGVKEKSVQKRKIFLRKSLTRPNLPEYNGVSQGDTPPPPGGEGGSPYRAKSVGTLPAAPLFSLPYLETLRNSHSVPTIQGKLV